VRGYTTSRRGARYPGAESDSCSGHTASGRRIVRVYDLASETVKCPIDRGINGKGDRSAESSGVKVSVGWGKPQSDPRGRRANRQAVADSESEARNHSHRKRMMG
jgi:hypothetical protein